MTALLLLLLLASWETQTSGVSVKLYDVDCISATEAWAVGASGTILHTADAGTTWTPQTSGTSSDLFGVDFVDGMNGWAVGAGPIVLHTADGGVAWSEQTSGASTDLFDVAFASVDRGWAVGPSGTIIGTSNGGASWNDEISGEWTWFNGVAGVTPTDAWAIGANWYSQTAPIFTYQGSSWSNQYEITQTRDGKGISFVDTLTGWGVGGSGTIAHTANGGSNWSTQTSGTTEMLLSVSAVSLDYCWAAGSNGTILCTNDGGSSWSDEQSGTTDTLFGIAMWDENNGWAVGENGLILHTQGAAIMEEPHHRQSLKAGIAFPNPVTSELHLSLRSLSHETISIRLHDVTGRLIQILYSGPTQSEFSFQVGDLPGGIYLLRIQTRTGTANHRILKI